MDDILDESTHVYADSVMRRRVVVVVEAELNSSRRKSVEKCDLWFKVTIRHGGRYTKDYILKILMGDVAPTVFSV
jgi:hypothetical protein